MKDGAGLRPLRAEDIEEYVVFRLRLQELLHIWTAWAYYGLKADDDREREIAFTINAVAQVWLYSFFDPKGLNVLRLWPAVFPWLKTKIRAWKAKYEPVLLVLEDFRHTTGAHFSRKIAEHKRVREAFTKDLLVHGIESFLDMAGEVVTNELRRPELVQEISSYGLPPALPLAE